LLTNEEWQRAVAGTPDPGDDDDGDDDCNISSVLAPVPTGSRVECVSNWGVADLVGNLSEWTADWDERATEGRCSTMPDDFGRDTICIGGPGDGTLAAIVRGGNWSQNADGGSFWLDAAWGLASRFQHYGFRCGR
jgi:formylglycine-generating enzyme required for sulfatase activity